MKIKPTDLKKKNQQRPSVPQTYNYYLESKEFNHTWSFCLHGHGQITQIWMLKM